MWPLLGALLCPTFQDPALVAPALPLPVPCTVDAWLEGPGGRIEFKLDVRGPRPKQTHPTFALLNGVRGEDLTWIERWETKANLLLLHVDSYDSHLTVEEVDGAGRMRGNWRKLRGPDEWVEMALHGNVRAGAKKAEPLAPPWTMEGRWSVDFSASEDPAVGVFAHPEVGKVSGTFLTTLGDYRYLAGSYDLSSNRWQLSCFDGAHAFLFTARRLEDGSLGGDFWSGDRWHETWTAKRDEHASLPDPFGLTKSNSNVDLAKLVFTAVDGAKISLADPVFAGKARIVQLFGSWCPNCNDEAEYLRELDRRYRSKGLSIVGLGFELTGDEARDIAQLERFATRHRLEYPLLLAGRSDKAAASKVFPLLDQVRAWPTTLFLRADGSVRAVHQGYCGPATGADHQRLREGFERLIGELLAEGKPAAR